MDITQIVMYAVLFISLYFEVFLLITFFEHRPTTSLSTDDTLDSIDTTKLPTATVIVPCFNEEKTVAGTINSLLSLNYPKEKLHIIAVNDGSTDSTAAVLEAFKNTPQVTILYKENGGKHTALNTALTYTSSTIVGCLDADSFVEKDALLYVAAHFKNPEVSAVTAGIKVYKAKSIIQMVQKAEYSLAIFVRSVFASMDAQFVTPGPFSFFRCSVIDTMGEWSYGHSTEDLEMCLRLQRSHHKITNEHRAIVYTTAPHSFIALYKQRVRWAYGFLKNTIDYSDMFLNPKYGMLGMFVLPLSLISIFGATFLFGSLLWNTLVRVTEAVIRFKTIGIHAPVTHFDLFYIQTNATITIVIALLLLTLSIIGIGKRLSNEPLLSFDAPLYLILYGFITPVWLFASIYKAAISKGVTWR